MKDKFSPNEIEAARKALKSWADHLDDKGSAFMGVRIHTSRAEEVLEYMEAQYPLQSLTGEQAESADERIALALRREMELREAGHEPFQWSFGQGPVYSCKLCAEAGVPPSEAEWPCTILQNEVAQAIALDSTPQTI